MDKQKRQSELKAMLDLEKNIDEDAIEISPCELKIKEAQKE